MLAALEVAYDLEAPAERWSAAIAHSLMPLLDTGLGVQSVVAHFRADGHSLGGGALAGGRDEWQEVWKSNWWNPFVAQLDTVSLYSMLKRGPVVSAQQLWATATSEAPLLDRYLSELSLQGWSHAFRRAETTEPPKLFYVDSLNLFALDRTSGECLALVANRAQFVSDDECARLRMVARQLVSHLRWALRARRTLGNALERGEAILSTDARVLHATGAARQVAAREALQSAARAKEKARSTRVSSEEALALMPGLVDGRWSLIDTFDLAGRRYLVAVPNVGTAVTPALTAREGDVMQLVSQGLSNKEIAFALGVTVSTVGTLLHRCSTKLGARSRVELMAHARGLTPHRVVPS